MPGPKIVNSFHLVTRSTIWCVGEPDMEPLTCQGTAADPDPHAVHCLGAAMLTRCRSAVINVSPGCGDEDEDWTKKPLLMHARQPSSEGPEDEPETDVDVELADKASAPDLTYVENKNKQGIVVESVESVVVSDQTDLIFAEMSKTMTTDGDDDDEEVEPDAEQDSLMTQTSQECSSGASTMTPKDLESLDIVSEMEIRRAVVAAVTQAVAVGLMEAALRTPLTPTPSAATSRSATGPLLTTASETPKPSPCPDLDPAPAAAAAAAIIQHKQQRRTIARATLNYRPLNLKTLAWCCR